MKELIVNADDFGFTRGVNEGIIRAHREGILTSATLMATAPSFDDAVERALANPKLGIGCHLVLTGGTAVSPPDQIPTLADQSGVLPRSLAALVVRLSSGRIRIAEIEKELRVQIEKIRRAGIRVTHLDTHKHTHAHPIVMGALARVARELGITRVRKPVEDLRDSWRSTRGAGSSSSKRLAEAAAVRAVGPLFDAIAKNYGLRSPDHFLGLAMTGRLSTPNLCRLIDTVAEGRTEIMTHPGVYDAELSETGSGLQQERQTELDALLSSEARKAIESRGIKLITYRDLN